MSGANLVRGTDNGCLIDFALVLFRNERHSPRKNELPVNLVRVLDRVVESNKGQFKDECNSENYFWLA